MSKIVIGVDPGKTGAVVALDLSGRPIEWMAADESGGYCHRGRYSPRALVDWMADLTVAHEVVLVVLEEQSVRPVEARRACFTTGFGAGMLFGTFSSFRLPIERVSPSKWTKSIFGSKGVKGHKERKARSVSKCQERLPGLPLTFDRRKKAHTGLADAGLLALYGLQIIPESR